MNRTYKPVILVRIKYKITRNNINIIGTKIRNFLILNKFLNGARITKMSPAILLIKNRGYRDTFVQKSLI